MRITTAGILLLLPRLASNTNGSRNNNLSLSNLIEKGTENNFLVPPYSKNSSPLQLSGILQKGSRLLERLDHGLSIGLPGADAAIFRKSKNHFEELSYNKGDDAESIDEFAKSVSQEYTVFSNKNAHNANKFKTKVIMIYGESHTSPLLPSIRNGKGALLLESSDLNRCLEKHKLYPDNICKHIDTLGTSILDTSTINLHSSVRALIQQMDPKKYQKIEKRRKDQKISSVLTLQEMMIYVNNNFKRIYLARNKNDQKKLMECYRLANSNYEENKKLQKSTLQDRDTAMVHEAKKIISTQANGEATTIVVGNAHVKGIFNALAKEFPEHAIVGCFTNHSPTVRRDAKDELVKGINAAPVKIPQKRIKTEL